MVRNSTTISGQIEGSVYSTENLPDDWNSRSTSDKMDYLDGVEPEQTFEESNVTTQGMHRYFAENLNPSAGTINLQADYLALGNDDTAPSSTDTTLNHTNEIIRKQVDSGSVTNNELQVDTLIEANEANGSTIREVGLFTDVDGGANERMLNHATIADIQKDDTRTVKIEVTLTFTEA